VNSQLVHDPVFVAVDRFLLQVHAPRDLLDAAALRKMQQYFELAAGQVGQGMCHVEPIAILVAVELQTAAHVL
jgi:hypothetical protein